MKQLFKKATPYVFAVSIPLLVTACTDDSDSEKNDPVSVATVEKQVLENGAQLRLQLNVSDPDDANNGSDITYKLIEGPDSLAINATGLITYTSDVASSMTSEVIIEVSDGGEDGVSPAEVSFTLEERFFYSIDGVLTSITTNDPIASGEIKILNDGEVITRVTSAEDGKYVLKLSDDYRDRTVTFSASALGFIDSIENYTGIELTSQADIRLQPAMALITFTSEDGASLQVDNNVVAVIPEGALQTQSGETYTGEVKAEVAVIDPLYNSEFLPGELIVIEGDLQKGVESFGAISVTLLDDQGRKVNITEGNTATIKIPAVSEGSLPDTVNLYYFDEINGQWKQEGMATLVNDGEEAYYEAFVSHFSFWNAAVSYENTLTLSGCVENKEGNRVSGVRVNVKGLDHAAESSEQTDSNGEFTIGVRQMKDFLVSAEANSQSRPVEIKVADESVVLEKCLVLEDVLTSITLRWLANPEDLDTHWIGTDEFNQVFHLYYENPEVTVNGVVNFLDVDDVTGYGPEILSIPKFTVPGTYNYYVHLYYGSGDIASGQASVEIDHENQKKTYFPPVGQPTDIWHALSIEVSSDLSVTLAEGTGWRHQVIESENVTIESGDEELEPLPDSPQFSLQAIQPLMSINKSKRSVHPKKK